MVTSSGERYQVIVLRVKRNEQGAVTELLKLQEYFKKHQSENYDVVGSFYGRKSNLLPRIAQYMLTEKMLTNQLKTLYDTNKVFMDYGDVNFFNVSALGWIKGIEEIGYFLKGKPHG